MLAVIEDGAPVLLPVKKIACCHRSSASRRQVRFWWACRRAISGSHPERTVRSIKRKMGRAETVGMAGETYTPQEISAFILKEIKEAAQAGWARKSGAL